MPLKFMIMITNGQIRIRSLILLLTQIALLLFAKQANHYELVSY